MCCLLCLLNVETLNDVFEPSTVDRSFPGDHQCLVGAITLNEDLRS